MLETFENDEQKQQQQPKVTIVALKIVRAKSSSARYIYALA